MIIESLLIFIASIVGYNAKDIKQNKDGKPVYHSEAGNPTPTVTGREGGGGSDMN